MLGGFLVGIYRVEKNSVSKAAQTISPHLASPQGTKFLASVSGVYDQTLGLNNRNLETTAKLIWLLTR